MSSYTDAELLEKSQSQRVILISLVTSILRHSEDPHVREVIFHAYNQMIQEDAFVKDPLDFKFAEIILNCIKAEGGLREAQNIIKNN